jgi:hypothetical protein
VRTHPVDTLLEQHCYKSAVGLLQLVRFYVCADVTTAIAIVTLAYTCKNLTSRSKSDKPSTSCVRTGTACPKLSTSLEQAVNNL